MRTRRLRTGVELTELGLGGAQLGNLYHAVSDEAAAGIVDAAWQAGIRYFDTAPHYGLGLSERRLGHALADYPRDEYVLSTKAGRLLVPDPHGTGRDDQFDVPATTRRQWDFSRDGVLRSVTESLERLGLDRVDIVYLHDAEDHLDQAVEEGAPALAVLRDEGVIRAFGAGLNEVAASVRFVERTDADVMMLAGRHTLLEQGGDAKFFPLALERGVRVVTAAVYNSGLLGSDRPPATTTYDYRLAPPVLLQRAHALADVCERHGVTLPQAALAFPLRHEAVASVVVGAEDARQVRQNTDRFGADVPPDLWDELAEHGLVPQSSG